MILRATPPDFFITAGSNVRRLQLTVQRVIPFSCYCRLQGFQIVEPRQNLFPCAIWASGFVMPCAGIWCRLIAVPSCAFPPNLCVRGRSHTMRIQLSVIIVIPLGCHIRKERHNIRLTGYSFVACAIRTARAAPCNAIHRCLPAMPSVALPPDDFL